MPRVNRIRSDYLSFVTFIIIVVFPALTLADNTESSAGKQNSLQPGSWALQFQIEPEFSLDAFDDLTLAMKRHLSRNTAFRIGVDLDLEFSDNDEDVNRFYADTLWSAQNTTRDQNAQRMELEFLYLNYPDPDAPVHFFWGAGPLVVLSRSKTETRRVYGPPFGNNEITTSESWSRSWALGGRGLFAVEWFVTKAISFHTEYRVSLRYTSGEYKNKSIRERYDGASAVDTNDGADDEWDFDADRVILGLNLYF